MDACLRVEEKLRGVLMQLECYHIQLCLTSLLQDADCNNWCGHTSFYEARNIQVLLLVYIDMNGVGLASVLVS